MILSFHPCFVGDRNMLCAGREPGEAERAAISAAHAVVLPQGCTPSLYFMARHHCSHVFPNYDTRFIYPGKRGQIALFEAAGAIHPKTIIFPGVDAFSRRSSSNGSKPPLPFPFVIKLDWGGEGDTVFLVTSPDSLRRSLRHIEKFEAGGQKGFLIQAFVPCDNRTLRVVKIGTTRITYWRVQNSVNEFGSSVGKGAAIDMAVDPGIQTATEAAVDDFCGKTGANLAGFDLIFSAREMKAGIIRPLFLEINYFFGRRGLGGSEKYYRLLESEIRKWIHETVRI